MVDTSGLARLLAGGGCALVSFDSFDSAAVTVGSGSLTPSFDFDGGGVADAELASS